MLAARMKYLAPSATLAVQSRARALRARGVDVISFGAGEPDLDTPERIKAAAEAALRRGGTRYTEGGGIPECYEALTFDGPHVSVAQLGPEVKARTVAVNTCSKAYAMTGWRIGYAAGPRELIRAMTDVQSQVTSNPSSIAPWAAVEALAGAFHAFAHVSGLFGRRVARAGRRLASSTDVAEFLPGGGAGGGGPRHGFRLRRPCSVLLRHQRRAPRGGPAPDRPRPPHARGVVSLTARERDRRRRGGCTASAPRGRWAPRCDRRPSQPAATAARTPPGDRSARPV